MNRRCRAAAVLAAALVVIASNARAAPVTTLIDDFSDISAWRASASEDVRASMRRAGQGLCLDFDFGGVSGYAVLHRDLAFELPRDYTFHARVHGSGTANDLQFKLVDASGANVWWATRPGFVAPAAPTDLRFKRRHIRFAWGPTQERELHAVHAIEFVIAAGSGGRGSFCVQRLALEERAADVASLPAPRATASASLGSGAAARAFDGRMDTAWRAPPGKQTLQIDFGGPREFNGLEVHWLPEQRALDYDVERSDDGRSWTVVRRVRGARGTLDALFLPASETRFLRLKLLRTTGNGYALAEIEFPDDREWPSLNSALAALAATFPRGDLPRAFLGEQNYWTLVAVDGGGARSALVSEDGAIELGRGGFSVEPTVRLPDGTRVTWADVRIEHSLRDGYLPLPTVRWQHPSFSLDVEVCAEGSREAPRLLARYVLRNLTDRALRLTLSLAVRPWQVNPPQQFLSTPGGASPIRTLRWTGGVLRVDERSVMRPTEPPARVTAAAFDAGIDLDTAERAPLHGTLVDPQAMASAALAFRVDLAPRGTRTLGWIAPLAAPALPPRATAPALDARFAAVAQHWHDRLNHAVLRVPAAAQPWADSLRTALAHILMARDGPALRPGTRSYARTWVRDGAMMVEALLALGESAPARDFVDWYAGHLFASGKVPCCVDARGSDPVAENDSQGQFLYAIAEVWRHTRDTAWLVRHWRDVVRATTYMEQLRQSQIGAQAACPGLMPPSISHEGYADKPACSYWDDFWALRGYEDAVAVARALDHETEAAQWQGWRDEFGRAVVDSIDAAGVRHGIDFIPGSADRGDFDPTSTAIALDPVHIQSLLPQARLAATFERYWHGAEERMNGPRTWKDYTPYELRNVGALVRLGERERADALLRFLLSDQRPRGWNQWAEVVLPRERAPHFLGDMPHAWVAAECIRSLLDLFAYARERDDALVLGAGLPREWVENGDQIEIRAVSTRFGSLSYRLARNRSGWTLEIRPGLDRLQGGLRLAWPGSGALPGATLDGRALEWVGRELVIPAAPATVMLSRS